MTAAWPLHDYVSPGLRVVRPDAAFPHLRAGDALHHPWKYLRREVPHLWYCDERYPLMGFLNRDEAAVLHNIALQFAGKRALEIGSWLGWSTCHLALGGVILDVIDPAHADPVIRASVDSALAECGVTDRVRLVPGNSPEEIAALGQHWSLFFIDGDHEGAAPLRDAMACLPYATEDCAFVFHDLASPSVAAGLRFLQEKGFHVVVYQTAQIMGMAWRGDVAPVAHTPDPNVAWQMPLHLAGLPVSGVDAMGDRRRAARRLREVFTDDPELSRAPSVCLVTSEFIGPFKNGGIGTANSGLAETLAAAGARVTVLYTGDLWGSRASLASWRKEYAERGITLEALSGDDAGKLAGPVAEHGYIVPWLVYRYLAAHPFDVVHFNDCCGEGNLALAAKSLGMAFAETLLVVGLHSPSRWVIDANQTLAATPLFAAFDYAERLSVSSADVLWSPSTYLVEWAAARGFTLPRQTFVQQYALPATPAERQARAPARVNEIVFFGRLEERKGLRVFCNAVHALRDELSAHGVSVTFLGKAERCGGMDSLDYIARRRESWSFPLRTITDLGQPEALAYLQREGVLAVMPSPLDNSPCTIYEALENGIPFLAARTGGIPELIDRNDRDRVLFEYGAEGLTNALRQALERGCGAVASPAVTQAETRRAWRAMHGRWRELLPPPETTAPQPKTFAAIVDHAPGAALHETITSLARCPSIRRYIVLNHAGESFAMPAIDLTTTDLDAVATSVAAIAEDVVLLIHSGVTVVPEAMEAMLQAMAAANADGLQPAARITSLRAEQTLIPLGGSVPFSLYEGATFTGALAVRRELLFAARQGRESIAGAPFLGLADFCVTHGDRILPYPEVVLEREAWQVVEAKSSAPARVAAYAGMSQNDRYYALAAGYAANGSRPASPKYRLARWAMNAGLGFAVRLGAAAWRRARRWMR